MDELRTIQDLIDGGIGLAERPDGASRDACVSQVCELALTAAEDHHRQQSAEHAFELDRRRAKERQANVMRWLRIVVAFAIVVLVIAVVGAAVVGLVVGRLDPLQFLAAWG